MREREMFNKLKTGFIFIMVFVFMFFAAGHAFSAPRQATLADVKGTVEVQKKGTKTWVKATEGMKVGEGDAIRTKVKSSCLIKWSADTMVKLTAFTNFAITKSAVDSSSGKENTTVSLFVGKTYSKVKKALAPGSSFEVSTPTAIAGVRSTYWVTEVSGDGSTLVGFLEGSGYLNAGGKTVDVPEGSKSEAKENKPPSEPKPMTEEEKKEHKSESSELVSMTDQYEMKLLVEAPANNTETTEEKIKVGGTVTAGSKVTVAGISASVDAAGKFVAEVELKMGENKLAVSATGLTGKTASVTVAVKRKKKEDGAPELMLKEPNDGTKTSSEKITVAGTAKNAEKAAVNGEEVKLGDDGAFSTSVTLKSGENMISVSASNDKGSTSVSVKVIYEPKAKEGAPSLTVTEPGDGASVTTSSVGVAGKADGATSVKINGNEVILEADGSFKGTVTLIEGDNTINIMASNDAGSTSASVKVTYSAEAADVIPPILSVTTPVNNSVTNQPSVLVSGTTEDGAKVTINGASATVSGGVFSVPYTLTEGTNTINVAASDAAGNKTTQSVTVTLDSLPPMLTITYPPDNFVSSTPSLTLTGLTDANVKVTVGSTDVTADGGGNFTVMIVLNDGDNTINIKAVDKAGNVSTVSKKVTYKSSPFFLTVSQPSDALVTRSPFVQVVGFTDPSATIIINGLATTVFPSGSFQLDVPLKSGLNTIIIQAKDSTGAIQNVVKQVTKLPPMLSVTAPQNGFLTNTLSVLVEGMAEQETVVTVNGVTVTSTGGSFSQTLTLKEGSNTITVVAKDKSGDSTTVMVNGTLDTIAPMLSVSTPSNGFITNNPVALVSGTSESDAAVTVNGVSVTSGSFSQSVTLTEGSNTISVVAKDKAGNTTTVKVTGTLDSVAPILTVAEPSDGAQTYKSQVKLVGFTEAGAIVKINGLQTTVLAGGSIDQCLSLNVGGNTFTLTSTDAAGNVQTAVKQVTRTDIPPLIDTVPPCQ